MKIFALVIFLPLTIFGQDAKKCSIKGVITYYFNEYQGDKPDVGAQIWVIDSLQIPAFKIGLSDTFYQGNFYRNIKSYYETTGKKTPQFIEEQLNIWRASSDSEFDTIDKRNFSQLLAIEVNKKTIISTVDGAGNYSIKASPGTYYVYIKSNGRQGNTVTEITGKCYIKRIKIEEGDEASIDHKFDIH